MVILVVLFSTVTGPLSELNVPAAPKHSAPVLIDPPTVPVVTTPADTSSVPITGSAAVLLVRHAIPPVSLMLNETPMKLCFTLVMFGSAPVNPAYRMCHGSVAARSVAVPDTHGPRLILVMNPVSAPRTFAIVLVCIDPSSVTWQFVVPNSPLNLNSLNDALTVWLLVEMLLADAVDTSAAMSRLAPVTAMSSLQILIRETSSSRWTDMSLHAQTRA